MIYWNLCENAHDIKANKSMFKGLFCDDIFMKFMKIKLFCVSTFDTRDNAKQRREMFCKPFAQMRHNRANET